MSGLLHSLISDLSHFFAGLGIFRYCGLGGGTVEEHRTCRHGVLSSIPSMGGARVVLLLVLLKMFWG